eukprot:s590_g3.t1
MFFLQAAAKGGTSGTGTGSRSGSGGGGATSRSSYQSAHAYGTFVILTAGTRRRYGVFNDPNDRGECRLASEGEMRSACGNLMFSEERCHACLQCEDESCIGTVDNCDEFLSASFLECCGAGDCGGLGAGAIIGIIVGAIALFACCCFLLYLKIQENEGEDSDQQERQEKAEADSSPQAGLNPAAGSGAAVLPCQVVIGQPVSNQELMNESALMKETNLPNCIGETNLEQEAMFLVDTALVEAVLEDAAPKGLLVASEVAEEPPFSMWPLRLPNPFPTDSTAVCVHHFAESGSISSLPIHILHRAVICLKQPGLAMKGSYLLWLCGLVRSVQSEISNQSFETAVNTSISAGGQPLVVVTYNLYWWCVSDEYGNCPQNKDGKGFQKLFARIQQNGPFDLIGFQECDDVGKVIGGTSLAASFEYYTPKKGNDAPMAWQHSKFIAIEGPGTAWISRDKYGDRHMNWVRLQVIGSAATIFFANTHGPLDQCGGGPGETVASNYVNAVYSHKKPGDLVVFTGDFNCGQNQDTIKKLAQAFELDATDTSYNGADHIFSSGGTRVLWKGSSPGSPSDHQLLKAVLEASAPSPPSPPAPHPSGCPVPPDNGGCCTSCSSNHYCPSNKGCYSTGQSGCIGGYCPAPAVEEVLV